MCWLRDTLRASNYIPVMISIEIHNLGNGENRTCMDSERVPGELGRSDLDIRSLIQRGLVWLRPEKPRKKERAT